MYKYEINKLKENFWHFIPKLLPRKLIYFSSIHLGAKVTTGKHSNTIVPDLTFLEAIKRFGDDNNV